MSGKTNAFSPSKVSHRQEENLRESQTVARQAKEQAPKDRIVAAGHTNTGQTKEMPESQVRVCGLSFVGVCSCTLLT
jgi:hypothetical protein